MRMLVLALFFLNGYAASQHRIGINPLVLETKSMGDYVFRYDTSKSWYFHSSKFNRSFNIDSLIIQRNRADSLCKEITFLSKKSESYFLALQATYTSLRKAGFDSLAENIKNIAWSYRFRLCDENK